MYDGLTVIIPVKPFAQGKSRLAELLSADERTELNRGFFERTLALADGFAGLAATLVVTCCPEVQRLAADKGASVIAEDGLNPSNAARQATAHALSQGARGVLVLPTDLPFATVDDLLGLGLVADDRTLTIVSDHDGTGTNILHHAQPVFMDYAFGPGSYVRHCASARAAGLRPRTIRNANLEFDVDGPDHFRRWLERADAA